MKKFRKILSVVMATTMMLSTTAFSGCFDFLRGSREISSIVVTNGSISTSYKLNETVSFEEMVITAKYNDASTETVKFEDVKVYLDNEDITNDLNKITESVGTKTVVIEYAGKKATITVTVSSETSDITTPVEVVGFSAPGSYTTHLNKKSAAGKTAYGKDGYEAEFMTGDDTYTAGDDNEFKFLPTLRFLNADDLPETAAAFTSETEVSLYVGTEYVALESRDGASENVVEYFSGEDVYLTANTANNTYDFADKAIGEQFKLSVMPAGNYDWSGNAVECEVTVVDGFNVYTAKQLAVIDNDTGIDTDEDRTDYWTDIKEAEGLTGVDPAAVIFQNDIKVTAADIPVAFQYTLNQEVTYYEEEDAATKTNPIKASDTFLYDKKSILLRHIKNGESFKIYGNYFNLDLSSMPLVCSFENDKSSGYGADGSNTEFFRIAGDGNLTADPTGEFTMENLSVKGNANISDEVYVTDSGEQLSVYAGGLLFTKYQGVKAFVDNILVRTTFIPFIFHGNSNIQTMKDTKAYDSYSNAAYVWGKNDLTLDNCNFARAGGPLIIGQHKDAGLTGYEDNYPTITATDNCNFTNMVTGQEFWFNSYGASGQVTNLRALNAVVVGTSQLLSGGALMKSYLTSNDDQGKFNMICLLMPAGSDATIVGQADVQGKFTYKGYEANRVKGTETGNLVHEAFNANSGVGVGVSFNIKSSFAILISQTTIGLPEGRDETTLEHFATQGESYLGINLGAFSLFVEYFDL